MINTRRNYNGAININNLNVYLVPLFGRGKYSFVHEGETYYFKYCNHTDEGYREMIAEEFAIMYGIEHANYDLGIYDGNLGALSKSISKRDEEFKDFFMLFCEEIKGCKWPEEYNNLSDMRNIIMPRYCGNRADVEYEKYVNYFIWDITIGNYDRNASNQGFIKKNGIYTYAPAFDNADFADSLATKDHHFAQGIDREDTKLVPRGEKKETKDRIRRFIEDTPYGEKLKDAILYLTEDRIMEAFSNVEERLKASIPVETKIDIFNKLTMYRNSLLVLLSEYYDGIKIKKRI